jgi:hypothetical protein
MSKDKDSKLRAAFQKAWNNTAWILADEEARSIEASKKQEASTSTGQQSKSRNVPSTGIPKTGSTSHKTQPPARQ